jgi:heme A synthase
MAALCLVCAIPVFGLATVPRREAANHKQEQKKSFNILFQDNGSTVPRVRHIWFCNVASERSSQSEARTEEAIQYTGTFSGLWQHCASLAPYLVWLLCLGEKQPIRSKNRRSHSFYLFRIMAALCLLCVIFGLAMVPRREAANQKQEQKKPFNYRILITPTFLLVFIGRLLSHFFATVARLF